MGGLTLFFMMAPGRSSGLAIIPTFVNGAGQTWNTTEEAVVDEAVQSWTSRILDNQTVNVTLDFTNAGTSAGTYLGEASTSYSEFDGTDIYPWTSGVTQVIHINADAMTTGISGDKLAFVDQSGTVGASQYDALSILRHEMGHMLGFVSGIYYNNLNLSNQVDKYASHVVISGSSATFDPTGLNVPLDSASDIVHTSASGITAGDLMNPSLPNGTRRDISQIDLNVLHLAYGYQIAQTLTWDAGQTGIGSDGSGNWTATATNWSQSAASSAWSSTSAAVIGDGGVAGTITIASSGISVSGITFNPVSAASPGQYTVVGSSADNLTLTGSGAMTMNADATISAPMVGSGGLTVAGVHNLTISGIDAYTGATSVNSGTLTLAGNGQITATSSLTIGAGAQVVMNNVHASNGITINYGSGTNPNSTIQSEIAAGAITALSGYYVGYANGGDGVVSGLAAGQEKIMVTLGGDATLSGTVNLTDFAIFRLHFLQTGMQWDQGDFNHDGVVNLSDFAIFRLNFAQSLPAAPQFSASGVAITPEPATAVLMMAALLPLALRRRHRIPSCKQVLAVGC